MPATITEDCEYGKLCVLVRITESLYTSVLSTLLLYTIGTACQGISVIYFEYVGK